jgi:hypothetical protein
MLDDDDWWPRDRLMVGVRAMGPGVGMSCGIQYMSDESLRPIFKFRGYTSYYKALVHAILFGEFFFPAKTYMFNTEFLQELRLGPSQWYCPHNSREDIDLAIRALKHSRHNRQWQVAYINKILACWVQPGDLRKFRNPEYERRQMEAHDYFARRYLPPLIRELALRTAPYTFQLPHWVKHGLI